VSYLYEPIFQRYPLELVFDDNVKPIISHCLHGYLLFQVSSPVPFPNLERDLRN
jgi:hypothetical protein